MILIIYPKSDLSTKNFINYLIEKKITHIALDIDQDILKSEIIIKDSFTDCTWVLPHKNLKIDFNLLRGIYNRIYLLDCNSFFDYSYEDIEYVQKEWLAYLTYRMKNFNNCINVPNSALLSGRALDFSYFYSIAKKIGIKIPEYFISSSYNELRNQFANGKEYIALSSLFFNNKFLPSKSVSQHDIALIECVKGKLILVHIVNGNFYCCILRKNEKVIVELSEYHKTLLLILKERLELKVMQLLMVQTIDDLYLLNVSLFPNWDLNIDENKKEIFSNLASLLSP